MFLSNSLSKIYCKIYNKKDVLLMSKLATQCQKTKQDILRKCYRHDVDSTSLKIAANIWPKYCRYDVKYNTKSINQ